MVSITLSSLFFSAIIPGLFLYFLVKLSSGKNPRRLPPGPKPWPIIGNLPHLGTKPHQTLAALARTYGPLMHLKLGSVHVVVVASAPAAVQFLKTHDSNFSSRPPNSGAKHIAYNYQDLVFAPYGPRWRMLRKICSVHLFSVKALDDFHRVRQVSIFFLFSLTQWHTLNALRDLFVFPMHFAYIFHQLFVSLLVHRPASVCLNLLVMWFGSFSTLLVSYTL